MAASTHVATTARPRRRSWQRVAGAGASVAALGAALVNLAVYGISRAAGIDFVVRMSGSDAWTTVGVDDVAGVSIVAVLLGAGAAWLARRWSPRLLGWVRGTGVVLAIASIGGPLSVTAVDGAAKPLLALMHLVAGVAFLYATRRR